MHVDNTSSFQDGNPPRPGEGALRHLGGDYALKQLKKLCDESLEHHNIEVEWQHVKAHQDEKKNRQKDKAGKLIPLTQAAHMNIDCDRRAEEFYSHPDETQQSSALINPIESMQVYFRSNGVINTGKLYTQIVRDRHGPPLKQYIKDKYHWNE